MIMLTRSSERIFNPSRYTDNMTNLFIVYLCMSNLFTIYVGQIYLLMYVKLKTLCYLFIVSFLILYDVLHTHYNLYSYVMELDYIFDG